MKNIFKTSIVAVALFAAVLGRAVNFVLISPGTNLVSVLGFTNMGYQAMTNQTIMSVLYPSNSAGDVPAGQTLTRTFQGNWMSQYVSNSWNYALPTALGSPSSQAIGGNYFPLDGPSISRYLNITVAGQYFNNGSTNNCTYSQTYAATAQANPVPIPGFGTNVYSNNGLLCTNFLYAWVTNYYSVTWTIPSNMGSFCFTTNIDTGALGFWGLFSDQMVATNPAANTNCFITNLLSIAEGKRGI